MEVFSSGLSVMFYNVENLFLPDDPTSSIKSKSKLYNWNDYRYQNKIHKISHVFELVKEETSHLPLLCGLAEVEGKQVLRDLLKNPAMKSYDFVHYDSLDERGIDVALLYNKKEVEILHSEPISYFFKIEGNNPNAFDTTRDVLYCKVRVREKIFSIFVLHLPSKRERDVNKPKREHIVTELSDRIAEIMTKEKEAVIVMGDFNDNPDSNLLQILTQNKNYSENLYNPFLSLYEKGKFSTFHNKFGLVFDQIILSQDFFSPSFHIAFKNANVFTTTKLSSWDRKFRGRPFRTYAGSRYIGGYSDHYPVMVEFEVK